jgi:hypothetical protein
MLEDQDLRKGCIRYTISIKFTTIQIEVTKVYFILLFY